jgi:hypothetical protein
LKNKTPILTKCYNKAPSILLERAFLYFKIPSLFFFLLGKIKKGQNFAGSLHKVMPSEWGIFLKNAPQPNLRSALISRMPHSSNITLHISPSQPNLPFPCTLRLLVVEKTIVKITRDSEKIPLSKFQILSSS